MSTMNSQSHRNDEDGEQTTYNHVIKIQGRLTKMKVAYKNKMLFTRNEAMSSAVENMGSFHPGR